MNSRNQESVVKYNEELIDSILNIESLTLLLANAARIIDVMNQSDDADIITEELTKAEHYAALKQVAIISDYFDQIKKCVVMDFIDYALKKHKDKSRRLNVINESEEQNELNEVSDPEQSSESEESSEEISDLQKIFCAIWLIQMLYQTDMDLYKIFSQPIKKNIRKQSFDVIYGPETGKQTDEVTYQFLFDPLAKKWECRRFSAESKDAQLIDDEITLRRLDEILGHVIPENLNPLIKKALSLILKRHEHNHQHKQARKRTKRLFEDQSEKLAPKVKEFCHNKLPNLAVLNNIHSVFETYSKNAKKKPALMSKLLLNDEQFELIDKESSELILKLAKSVEWSLLENLLDKVLLRGCVFDIRCFVITLKQAEMPDEQFRMFSKFCFDRVSQEQFAKLHDNFLYRLAIALSNEDFIKYRNQGKIRFDYADRNFLEGLYKSHPAEFPHILEEMLTSGSVIDEIPDNEEILKHFVNLLFKHEGQWFYLISSYIDSDKRRNNRANLLSLAMKMDSQKTLAIIRTLTREDSLGNKFLPIGMNAEEITKLIIQSPQDACVLLDYVDVLDTLEQETFSVEANHGKRVVDPFGEIRRFDLLSMLLERVPASYGEKLLRRGLLFVEKGMPYFRYLTGFNHYIGRYPDRVFGNSFKFLYKALSCSAFMAALTEGLMRNQKVDRLFLKEISDINLLELAKVLSQFTHISHIELTLFLDEDNQENIIKFFAKMKETNPHLKYHIQVKITEDKKQFEFITNYLSNNDIKVISLTIKPKNRWLKLTLLDNAKPDMKNFLDSCIKKICQKNSMLRQVFFSGLFMPKSIFFNDERAYTFAGFPFHNTRLFSMEVLDDDSSHKKDTASEELLSRNRNINALRVISDQLRNLQNVLELLPWLTLYGMPVELVVDIFDRLNYQSSLPSTIPPYRFLLNSIKKSHEHPVNDDDESSKIDNFLVQIDVFFKSRTLHDYYRYKPHKKNIHDLEEFFGLNVIQGEVIDILTDWYASDRRPDVLNKLDQFRKLDRAIVSAKAEQRSTLFALRSSFPLILELDGLFRSGNSSVKHFCEMISKLCHYQKAVTYALKQLRREAYVEFQLQGPIHSLIPWNDLALQSFDGMELRKVLEKYNPKNDISASSNIFSKIVSQVFTDFDKAEKIIFKNIMLELELYLKQKAKPIERQCDRHKHMHKTNLLNLISDDKIVGFKNSKPRLYQILQMQQKRLSASISKCSVKLVLRHSGLFSVGHEKKKESDKIIILDYEDQVNKKVLLKK